MNYLRFFEARLAAEHHSRLLNRSKGKQPVYVVVDGPENNFAVMDIDSAIENDFLYSWYV